MEYEVFEPEQDEYYDEACSSAFSKMFSEGRSYNENDYEDSVFFVSSSSDC